SQASVMAWSIKRLVSTFKRAISRPHRPRSASIRSIMEHAGIPVPAASTAGSCSDDDSMGEGEEEEEMEDDPPLEDVMEELAPSSAMVPAEPAIPVKLEKPEEKEEDLVLVAPPSKKMKKEARTETASKSAKATMEPPSEKEKALSETGKKAPSETKKTREIGESSSESGKAPTSESGKAPTSESGKAPTSEAAKGPTSEAGKGPTTPTSESGKSSTKGGRTTGDTRKAPTETREAPIEETREALRSKTREAPTTKTREAPTTETREAATTETREAATTETREALPVRKRVKDPTMLKLKRVLEDGVKSQKSKHLEAGSHDGAMTPTSTVSTAASTFEGGNTHVVIALGSGCYECQGCGLMGDLATITTVECDAKRLAKIKELEKLRELTLSLQELKRQRLYERDQVDLPRRSGKAPTPPSSNCPCTDNLETQVWMEDSQPPWDPACKALSFEYEDSPESDSEQAEPLMHVAASHDVLRRSGRGIANSEIEIGKAKPATEATKPKIATEATKPKIATEATKPEIAMEATKPEIATKATKPEIANKATKPEIATTHSGSNIAKARKGELKADRAGEAALALPEKPACMYKIPPSICPKDQKHGKREPKHEEDEEEPEDEMEAAGEEDLDGDAATEAPEDDEEDDARDDDDDGDEGCDDAEGNEEEEDEEEKAPKRKVLRRPAAKAKVDEAKALKSRKSVLLLMWTSNIDLGMQVEMLELFSGDAKVSQVFREAGKRTVSYDMLYDPKGKCMDFLSPGGFA
ncbi:unnamed protein product, partial [Symbiodinium necroappetens]